MKLLNKETLVTLKNTERKREIEEGAKLARKVDALRKASAEEEANLAKFRTETITRVRDEIKVLIDQKNALQAETAALSAQREVLCIPLDKEWEKVRTEKERVATNINKLLEQEQQLQYKEIRLKEREEGLVIEDERIREIKKRKVEALIQAEDRKKEAEDLLHKIKQESVEILEAFGERNKEISLKEAEVEANRRDLENRKKLIDEKEEEIRLTKIQLADQRVTLEIEFNRLKR